MRRVGLTGGIGSGKSAVAGCFARCGAVVIDADELARLVVAPGSAGLARVVDRFGPEVLAPDGTLDRAVLAARVFADPEQRRALEEITHPLIAAETVRRVAQADPAAVLVHDVPLLVEQGMAAGFEAVVVVEAPLELRLARLARRGVPEAAARARMAVQASDDQRRAVATYLIRNDGSMAELAARVGQVWSALVSAG